jgi:hypothetical protein
VKVLTKQRAARADRELDLVKCSLKPINHANFQFLAFGVANPLTEFQNWSPKKVVHCAWSRTNIFGKKWQLSDLG